MKLYAFFFLQKKKNFISCVIVGMIFAKDARDKLWRTEKKRTKKYEEKYEEICKWYHR
jgi:hypothetical protein